MKKGIYMKKLVNSREVPKAPQERSQESIKSHNVLKEHVDCNKFEVPSELKDDYKKIIDNAKGLNQAVAHFLEKNEKDFYNYLSNYKVEINGEKNYRNLLQPMTPLGLLDHLRNYALSKHNENVAKWFQDQWNDLYDSSKKKPSSDWTDEIRPGNLDNKKIVEKAEGKEGSEGPEVSSKAKSELMEKPGSDKTGKDTKPPKIEKPQSRIKKHLRNMWKFLARKTLDGLALPVYTAGLIGKGVAHEMRHHPVRFGLATVGLYVTFSAGLAFYAGWLAYKQHKRNKKAKEEGTQPPPETRSWPALAHQFRAYDGHFRNRVNKMGDSMLNLYERLGGKDLQREAPEKKKSGNSPGEPQEDEKSKHKENSGTGGQGEINPSLEKLDDQGSQIPNASEEMTSKELEASQSTLQEMAKTTVPGEDKKKIRAIKHKPILKKLSKHKKDQSKRVRIADRIAPQTSMSRPTENRASSAYHSDARLFDEFSRRNSWWDLTDLWFSPNQQYSLYNGTQQYDPYGINRWQSSRLRFTR
jgi:hypothetical protein